MTIFSCAIDDGLPQRSPLLYNIVSDYHPPIAIASFSGLIFYNNLVT